MLNSLNFATNSGLDLDAMADELDPTALMTIDLDEVGVLIGDDDRLNETDWDAIDG